ncbi:MAG: hypothetical protein WCG63_13930 [Opitutaceae bacterium]
MPSSHLGLPLRFHLYVWGALLALIVALIALNRTYAGRDIWNSITESSDLRRSNYAERIYRQNFFRTRANTWSNLAYVALGFYAFAWAAQDHRRASPSNSAPRPSRSYLPSGHTRAQRPVWSNLLRAGPRQRLLSRHAHPFRPTTRRRLHVRATPCVSRH